MTEDQIIELLRNDEPVSDDVVKTIALTLDTMESKDMMAFIRRMVAEGKPWTIQNLNQRLIKYDAFESTVKKLNVEKLDNNAFDAEKSDAEKAVASRVGAIDWVCRTALAGIARTRTHLAGPMTDIKRSWLEARLDSFETDFELLRRWAALSDEAYVEARAKQETKDGSNG